MSDYNDGVARYREINMLAHRLLAAAADSNEDNFAEDSFATFADMVIEAIEGFDTREMLSLILALSNACISLLRLVAEQSVDWAGGAVATLNGPDGAAVVVESPEEFVRWVVSLHSIPTED